MRELFREDRERLEDLGPLAQSKEDAKAIRDRRRQAGLATAHATNRIAVGVLWVAAGITVVALAVILLYVLINGAPSISPSFIFTWPHGVNAEGGIWPTIVSTIYVTFLAMLIATPIAVLAAVYLAEYAKQGKLVTIIRFAADSLASVPSIVMGLFGLAFFIETFNYGTDNRRQRVQHSSFGWSEKNCFDEDC